MVNYLLGQQGGYTKHPCFLCYWDSRAKSQHWVKDGWPERNNLKRRDKNIINEPLVEPEKIILPFLHIKLGLMKQFFRAFDFHGDCFKYIGYAFPGLSEEKLKAGIFNGPHIRQLIKDSSFVSSMTSKEALTEVIKNFLGNKKAENYKDLLEELLSSFEEMPCNMSIKPHYLKSHANKFPQNLGSISEEQRERLRSPAPFGLGRNGCWPPRGSQFPFIFSFPGNSPFIFSLCCPLNDRRRAAHSIYKIGRLFSLFLLSYPTLALLRLLILLLLLMSGSVHPNPGPIFPCSVCAGKVTWRGKSVQCCTCSKWVHLRCSQLSLSNFRALGSSHSWSCPPCRNTVTPPSSDSSDTYTSTMESGPPSANAALSPHPRLRTSYPPSAHLISPSSALPPPSHAPGCTSAPPASSPP